jgi:oxalate decarboxylase/phosphoglucose isomerase-like protein (cupin superfamily)
MTIKHVGGMALIVFCAMSTIAIGGTADSTRAAQPFVKHLPTDTIHYGALVEPPVSRTMESGCMALLPGDSAHEHSTRSYEEMLVILEGTGELAVKGQEPLPVAARDAVYIPPQTTHFIRNTGKTVLQYVFVAADTKKH